ncbi:unnamed protein product [Arabidopsis lyrata]|nr:unnamed protein product [Arabidopsis lyrata]
MTSSSSVSKYLPRLYEEGRSPLQHRIMNHNCYVSKIGVMREALRIKLAVEIYDEVKELDGPVKSDSRRKYFNIPHLKDS